MRRNIYGRFKCPCCGYPTLDERAAFDICVLCNWEDDGQDDLNADEVWGGPNAGYSLTEARKNFKTNYIMYSKDRDTRIIKGQTSEEIQIKKDLMNVFHELEMVSTVTTESLQSKVLRLEGLLHKITHEKIKKYENNLKIKIRKQ